MPEPSADRPRTGRPQTPWPIILGLLAIVVVPLTAWEIPLEQQRWQVAKAVQLRQDGDENKALEILDEILEKQPSSLPILLLRAEWQWERGEGDRALADLDQALRIRPDEIELLMMRGQILQAMERHQEAIKTYDIIVASTWGLHESRATALNMAAYARAIGDVDLKQGLDMIDEAIKELSTKEGSTAEAALRDTRGFLLYRLERYPEALLELEAATQSMNGVLELWNERKKSFSTSGSDLNRQERGLLNSAAVIVYHRGLVFAALGSEKAAKTDFDQVREWGEEPGEKLY